MKAVDNKSVRLDESGTALIEGAVLLPMLFVLIFGVFEFSWLICQRHIMLQGIRDAARYIAQSADPNGSFIKEGAKLLAATGNLDGGPEKIKGWSADTVDISYTIFSNSDANGLAVFRGGPIVQEVTVSTRLTLPSLGFFGLLGLSPPMIVVSDTERVIGSD